MFYCTYLLPSLLLFIIICIQRAEDGTVNIILYTIILVKRWYGQELYFLITKSFSLIQDLVIGNIITCPFTILYQDYYKEYRIMYYFTYYQAIILVPYIYLLREWGQGLPGNGKVIIILYRISNECSIIICIYIQFRALIRNLLYFNTNNIIYFILYIFNNILCRIYVPFYYIFLCTIIYYFICWIIYYKIIIFVYGIIYFILFY